MTPIIEDAILGTDLDGRFYNLLNINALIPVPSNLATIDHPGWSDHRPPVAGSVTNDSVAIDAGIVQSKLNLDGQIPTAWLGTTATTAAQGNLAEYLSNKNVPGGYAGLDSGGKVPSANLPGTTGTGTVTSVGLSMPASFVVSGSPVTGAGVLAAAWAPVADLSWFGNKEGVAGPPQFYTDSIPPSLIPDLDASMVTSGIIDPDRLPVAVGLGSSSAPGAVPAPGDLGTASDYLGRDMLYHAAPDAEPDYQPTLINPTLKVDKSVDDPAQIMITLTEVVGVPPDDEIVDRSDEHTTYFYSLVSGTTGFKEFPPSNYVHVPIGGKIYAYAAHAGYKNSAVVHIDPVT